MGSNLLSLPNSSSTSSTSRWKYDVFLNFRGEDTRYNFTDHLYTALVKRGIVTFRDDENLERGKIISPELSQAIEDSRFAIVILSENYATSSWCLDELAKIIKQGMRVLPVFHYVDPSDVRKQTGTFKKAFDAHEKGFEEKRVKTWRDALTHVGNLAGCHLKNISPETQEIQRIVRQISRTVRYKFSELTNKDLVGIYPQAMELESLLALDQFDDVQFIGVWAMGGMGKTTLAQYVYDEVLEEFEGSCFISDVGGNLEKYGLRELQKRLILKLLNESNLDCDDDHDLSIKIRTRLRHKRILLVLDGVDGLDGPYQLKMLAREHDWFGRGSRIIITTRDKHLLGTHSVDKIYEVKPMGYKDARHLFCLKAFKREHIPDEYSELSTEFLYFVDGLPLALEVLGLFLFGKSTLEWKSALERIKGDPMGVVIKVLQISFDGLSHSEKEIFLHIACLFNHEKKDYVVEILRSLDLYPEIGLRELIDKSLLKISFNNELCMHNLLREMGRNIVRQESLNEPGKRSRLWLDEDIDHVLKNNTGTEKVQAIDIRGAKETSICHEDKEACPQGSALLDTLQGWVLSSLSWQGLALLVTLQGWVQWTLSWQGFTSSKKQKGPLWNHNAFLKMPNLKFLRVRNINLLQFPTQLSNNLRFIEWSDYPSKSLPFFQPNELVQLRLQRSKVVILWEGEKNSDKLKFIDLADSSNLIISPEFTGIPNLEKLVLARCSNLHQLHPSIGNLKKLIRLDLKQCKKLRCLPDFTGALNLERLVLAGCSNLRQLHPSIGNLKKLIHLDLKQCKELRCLPDFTGALNLEKLVLARCSNLRQLHPSIGNLEKLILLDLKKCKELSCLPEKFEMESLEILNLSYCSKVKKVPEFVGDMKRLQKLHLGCTAITELPSSVECLTGLKFLILAGCKNLQCLPNTICSLTLINNRNLRGCSKFDKLSEYLGNIGSLTVLNLSRTAIKELPLSVGSLTGLFLLNLKDCKNFVFLPSSICNLKLLAEIDLRGCSKFVNLPDNLGNLEYLGILLLEGTAIETLPSSIGSLTDLQMLTLEGCKNLRCLPNTICSLKHFCSLDLSGCSKIVYLPKDLGKTELMSLYLNGTSIKKLPFSTIFLKRLVTVDFKGCQWPFSFDLMRMLLRFCIHAKYLDLSDCHLLAIPNNIGCLYKLGTLDLSGNDFVSLPKSISHLFNLRTLYLVGCKRLRSLPNLPSKVVYIIVNNCTSLERLPGPNRPDHFSLCFKCTNCFKLADKSGFNMLQGQSGKLLARRLPSIIPGSEIPSWLKEVKICEEPYNSYVTSPSFQRCPSRYANVNRILKTKKVNIQVPFNGCDKWKGILLCLVCVPRERHRYPSKIDVYSIEINGRGTLHMDSNEESYCKFESHHLWLVYLSAPRVCCSIDYEGFHQVEIKIATVCLEVEKIGFGLVYEEEFLEGCSNRSVEKRIRRQYLLL